jgi:hypothetical protein
MVQCPLAAPAAASVLEGVGDWNAGALRGRPLPAVEGWVGNGDPTALLWITPPASQR